MLCAAGYSSASEGASECEACPPGKFKSAGAGACLDCAVAKYADEEGSSECKLSSPGYFIATEGSSFETQCPPGTSSGSAASSCARCENGTYASGNAWPPASVMKSRRPIPYIMSLANPTSTQVLQLPDLLLAPVDARSGVDLVRRVRDQILLVRRRRL